jgi:hypothetical protein
MLYSDTLEPATEMVIVSIVCLAIFAMLVMRYKKISYEDNNPETLNI